MTLSEYVRAILHESTTYTASTLDIDGHLARAFYRLLQKSEQEVREYGLNLKWEIGGSRKKTHVRLESMGIEYRGLNANAVDMNTAGVCNDFKYIGDFHTHPYVTKYGAGFAIGPSNGDWMEWSSRPPAKKPIGVHCVASGDELFVVIFRSRPAQVVGFRGITDSALRLNDAVRNLAMNDDRFSDEISATRHGQMDWDRYRVAITNRLGQVRAHHDEDTHAMNRELANANQCEYFRGPLKNGSGQLHLVSNRVHGSWLKSFLWSSDKG